jgi:isocitrate lyase
MLQPKEARTNLENWDYLTPIVADGDMGFGGLTSTVKMTKLFVEAGVAMFHLDDLAIGKKKFTVGQGRTVVPTSEYLDRLTAARMQIDIMGYVLCAVSPGPKSDSQLAPKLCFSADAMSTTPNLLRMSSIPEIINMFKVPLYQSNLCARP